MNLFETNKEAKERMAEALEKFAAEIATIRTGRAQASILDTIFVDYYGAKTALKQVATIKTPEPSLIIIEPWDKSLLKEIEKAIVAADLGFNPTNDGRLIRIVVPPLTEERRRELGKRINTVAETARIALRNIRKDVWERVQRAEKEGEISEDEKYRGEADLNKIIDEFNKKIEDAAKSKEKELMEI